MAETIFGLPFDREIFIDTWNAEPDPTKTAMINSGAVVSDGVIAEKAATGSDTFTVPFYHTLTGTPGNYDGTTDITTAEISGDSQTCVAFGRTQGFSSRDFTYALNSADPMGFITSSVAKFWNKNDQTELLGILSAIFGITGASGNAKKWHDNHTVNLCSDTATPYTIGAADLNNLATQAMGDQKDQFGLVIMHSNVARTLENMKLLEFWKQTDANGIERPLKLASCNGYTVVIDDGVPTEVVGGTDANQNLIKYTTYLLGNGCIRTAKAKMKSPQVEPWRDPAKNGGTDLLYTRVREVIHPNGFSFTPPATGYSESPTPAQLSNTANWSIKFDPKAIPMAALITNG